MEATQEGPYGPHVGKLFKLYPFSSIETIGVAYTDDGTNSTIDGITITYTYNGVPKTVTFGKIGDSPDKFTLEPGEFIESVEGHFGTGSSQGGKNCVRQLTFKTSKNMTHVFPKNSGNYEEGTPFNFPKNNGIIDGFLGYAEENEGPIYSLGGFIKDGCTGGSTGSGI